MSPASTFLLAGVLSYLLGSVPFGFLVARLRGVDIRTVGSGNIGATNVFRCVGKSWGLLTFVCDMGKGFVAAFAVPRCLPAGDGALSLDLLAVVCACCVVAGHNWPVFLRFRGGKGIATSAGVLIGISWQAVVIGFAVWVVVFLCTRYVSVASIAAAVTIAVAAWGFAAAGYSGRAVPVLLTVLAVLAVWRHKANIRRLRNGTENRFDLSRSKTPTREE